MSHSVTECSSSRIPHQRLTCSGFVIASHTSCLGASKRRVKVISRSDGVVAANVSLLAAWLTGISALLSFRFPCLRFRCLRFPGLQFPQVVTEPVETPIPDVAVALGPLGNFLEGGRFNPAG